MLYGIGARLDQSPELLFSLRQVDAKDLVTQASAAMPKTSKTPTRHKVLADTSLADVFGIELAEAPVLKKPVKSVKPVKPKPAKPVTK